MKRILFRADAAPHIGIGDLMSLINISKYFKDDYEKYFIVKDYKASIDLVHKYEVENCFIIPSTIQLDNEVEYINNFINQHEIDIVFFEITERKLSDYSEIVPHVKKVCVNFDGCIPNHFDLVIDWDVEAYKYFDTLKYPNTKFLLGPEYVILPKEFYSAKVLNRTYNKRQRVMIAMGGADEFDFTSKVVGILVRSNLKIDLNIIVGAGYENIKKLEKNLQHTNLKYEIKQNITNMLDEYLSCDIGIGAGGLTSSELVATNTSAILIATYEHQIARCEYFDKQKWANYLGFKQCKKHDLINAILNPNISSSKVTFNTMGIVEEINELF